MNYYRTRYKGGFVSQKGEQWWIEIQMREDVYIMPQVTSELTFPADDPAVIEWDAKAKEEVLQGSSLTLKIESPGDRTYLDLYTVDPTAVRAVVYRDSIATGNVFWVGMLDPEFYEEPYERADKYDVMLTFTDFGVFRRFKPSLPQEINTLEDYLNEAITLAGYADILKIKDHISTRIRFKDNNIFLGVLSGCYMRRSNFTDEEGEVMNYNEVLEGIFQPLGIRLIQRSGYLVVYDLETIATDTGTFAAVPVEWDGYRQTLSTDKVANKAKVVFSPYGNATLLNDEIEPDDVKDNITGGGSMLVWDSLDGSYETEGEAQKEIGEYIDGFRFNVGLCKGDFNKAELSDKAMLFYNTPIYTGTDDAGIATMYPAYPRDPEGVESTFKPSAEAVYKHYEYWQEDSSVWSTTPPTFDSAPIVKGTVPKPFYGNNEGEDKYYNEWRAPDELFRTKGVRVEAGNHDLRISLPVIFDGHYNPFNTSAKFNGTYRQQSWGVWTDYTGDSKPTYSESFKSFFTWVYIPVRILLYGDDGSVWHFYNYDLGPQNLQRGMTSSIPSRFEHTTTRCKWLEGEGEWNVCWLCYYDFDDREKGTGIGQGWKTNKPICVNYTGDLPETWQKREEGEYIPAPPVSGTLVIHVGTGIVAALKTGAYSIYNPPHIISQDKIVAEDGAVAYMYRQFLRWMLYQLPKIEMVDSSTGEKIECDDIEYTGIVNETALEDIEINTICGTGAPAFARGVYLMKSNGDTPQDVTGFVPVEQLTRADRTDCPEQLLIGTLFSQYHDRCVMLSGEMVLPQSRAGVLVYSDANMPGKRFMMKGEVISLIGGTTDAVLVEVKGDNWTAD